MFGFYGSNSGDWFSASGEGFGFSSANNRNNSCGVNNFEARCLRNEQTTRDYFRNTYGVDPVDLGFNVPDWDWY